MVDDDSSRQVSTGLDGKPTAGVDGIKAHLGIGFGGLLLILVVAVLRPLLPAAVEGSALTYWMEVGTLLLSELGVALVIAYIVATGIDAQARRTEAAAREREAEAARIQRQRESDDALEREKRLVGDVFRGVFGIQHSPTYVRKVIETNLERKVIRRDVTLLYQLTRIVGEEATRLDVEEGRFVYLDQVITWTLQNLSTEEIDVDVRFAVAVRHGIRIRDASKLMAVTIGTETFRESDINSQTGPAVAGRSIQEDGDDKSYSWKRKIPTFGKLPVSVSVRVVKEVSDNEVWCSLYPCTEGMTLNVSAPSDLVLGVRNNTASVIKNQTIRSGTGMGVWKIEGPILPNDSVVFYWRTAADDGKTRSDEPARSDEPVRPDQSSGEDPHAEGRLPAADRNIAGGDELVAA